MRNFLVFLLLLSGLLAGAAAAQSYCAPSALGGYSCTDNAGSLTRVAPSPRAGYNVHGFDRSGVQAGGSQRGGGAVAGADRGSHRAPGNAPHGLQARGSGASDPDGLGAYAVERQR